MIETPPNDRPPGATTCPGVLPGILVILALVLLVYRPVLPGVFLMDDARLIGPDNPLVNGGLTPRSIWFQTDFTLATFGWWVEDLVFGRTHPGGFHLVNQLLQATSGIFLWRLLAQLKIPGGWLAGAMFAVHPVAVCSVARVAELKNTLALPFYLLALIGYLRYEAAALYPAGVSNAGGRQKDRKLATLWLVISLLSFVLALLAKTAVVMLPVILLLCALWQRRRINLRDLVHLSPYFLLSLAFGLMSVWFQKHQALTSTHEVLQPSGFLERLATAGDVVWFYLGKALWPVNLSVVYSPWKVDAGRVAAFVPGLLLVAVFAVCWRFRRGWGGQVLFGLGCFVAALFPALGFFDAQFLTRWQVSDHLQYVAMIAIPALVAAGVAKVAGIESDGAPGWRSGGGFGNPRYGRLGSLRYQVAAVVVLAATAGLAYQRAKAFASEETLMRDTIAKNPAAWPAHTDLGVELAKQGNIPGAIAEFKLALADQTNNPDVHRDLSHAYLAQGNVAAALAELTAALEIDPGDPVIQRDYGNLMKGMGRKAEALEHLVIANALKPDAATREDLAAIYYLSGDAAAAARLLRGALALNPDAPEALKTLAWILATSRMEAVRNGAEAVQDAQRACQLTGFKRAEFEGILGAAYAEAGNFPQAIAAAELANQLATQAGDERWMAISRQFVTSFQAGKPWRE
jgi:Flp pilus assembly protein TadD